MQRYLHSRVFPGYYERIRTFGFPWSTAMCKMHAPLVPELIEKEARRIVPLLDEMNDVSYGLIETLMGEFPKAEEAKRTQRILYANVITKTLGLDFSFEDVIAILKRADELD